MLKCKSVNVKVFKFCKNSVELPAFLVTLAGDAERVSWVAVESSELNSKLEGVLPVLFAKYLKDYKEFRMLDKWHVQFSTNL